VSDFRPFPQLFLDRMGVGSQTVGLNQFRDLPCDLSHPGEESFRTLHIPRSAQVHVHQVAILVDSPIAIAPLPLDSDVSLVDFPDFADLLRAAISREDGQKPDEKAYL